MSLAESLDAGLAADEPLRIGRVVAVSGSQIIVLLERAGAPEAIQVGALVKMYAPEATLFGLVSGLSIPIPAQEDAQAEMKIVEIEMIGEATGEPGGKRGTFRRGVSAFPALGEGVFASSQEDLSLVYARPSAATVRIGTIHQDKTLPAFVITDDLLGKHFAILGTTGSGKSCAVALILHALRERHPHARVVVLDPHNEYARAFGEAAEVLDPASLELPYWLFTFEEFVEIAVGAHGPERESEVAILRDAIAAAKRRHLGQNPDVEPVTVDTPVPYRLGDVGQFIDDAMGKMDKPESSAPYLRLKSKLAALQQDQRFAFMFPGVSVRDTMARILARIFRVPVAGKPITIIDLSGVPSEILNVVVSVLCRMTFDFALWSERALPILLACEEAHRYAPQAADLGFEPAKRALARIAKEGRKYGVSLCVVSQRPSELAAVILSQCNTIFALRMTNQKDQDAVRGTMAESALGLLDCLPSLRNAEAIVVGEGVPVPLRMCLDELPQDRRPLSGSASFSSAWAADTESEGALEDIVRRWRRQRR